MKNATVILNKGWPIWSFQAQLLRIRFLGTAFLPALAIEKSAVFAFPGVRLVANLHVVRLGAFIVRVIMISEEITDSLDRGHRECNVEENLLPLGHFLGGFFGRVCAKFAALWGPQSGGTDDGSPGELTINNGKSIHQER